MPRNPFNFEENLQPWFERDREYQNSRDTSLNLYLRKSSRELKFILYLKELYLSLIYSFTKNALLATTILIIALISLSVSAAELVLAPNSELRPSNIIKNLFEKNKQVERDPYTSLIPDSENDVATLADCNLSVKFPKQVSGKKMGLYYLEPEDLSYDKSFVKGLIFSSEEDIKNQNDPSFKPEKPIQKISMGCAKSPDKLAIDRGKTSLLTPDQLREKTGWFITIERDITQIEDFEKSQGPFHDITLKYQDMWYYFFFTENSDKLNSDGLFGNQIQVQFNDLAVNQPNTEIQNLPEQTSVEPETNPDWLYPGGGYGVYDVDSCDIHYKASETFEYDGIHSQEEIDKIIEQGKKTNTIPINYGEPGIPTVKVSSGNNSLKLECFGPANRETWSKYVSTVDSIKQDPKTLPYYTDLAKSEFDEVLLSTKSSGVKEYYIYRKDGFIYKLTLLGLLPEVTIQTGEWAPIKEKISPPEVTPDSTLDFLKIAEKGSIEPVAESDKSTEYTYTPLKDCDLDIKHPKDAKIQTLDKTVTSPSMSLYQVSDNQESGYMSIKCFKTKGELVWKEVLRQYGKDYSPDKGVLLPYFSKETQSKFIYVYSRKKSGVASYLIYNQDGHSMIMEDITTSIKPDALIQKGLYKIDPASIVPLTNISAQGVGCRSDYHDSNTARGECYLVDQNGEKLSELYNSLTDPDYTAKGLYPYILYGFRYPEKRYLAIITIDQNIVFSKVFEIDMTTRAVEAIGYYVRIYPGEPNCEETQADYYTTRCFPWSNAENIAGLKQNNDTFDTEMKKYFQQYNPLPK